jgi:hypothetical protein
MISVDLDRASPVLLLRAYLSAKRIFPNVPIEVFTSPSGVGFHIKIHKQVTIEQNLKLRALLWDEPYRLYYALKKWALNPREEYVDLVFDEKNDGKEKRIDMDAILKPYKREVQKISELVQKGETEKAEELVQKVAKAIEPELDKHKHKQYVGCIAFKTDELHDQLEEICKKIMEKDKTFSWKLYPCWFPEFDWILAIFGTDKDTLWKKLVWFKNRAYVKKDDKIIRILKDVDTRLFIKERKAT